VSLEHFNSLMCENAKTFPLTSMASRRTSLGVLALAFRAGVLKFSQDRRGQESIVAHPI